MSKKDLYAQGGVAPGRVNFTDGGLEVVFRNDEFENPILPVLDRGFMSVPMGSHGGFLIPVYNEKDKYFACDCSIIIATKDSFNKHYIALNFV